jgi:polyisoprenoid-binding protein YceI
MIFLLTAGARSTALATKRARRRGRATATALTALFTTSIALLGSARDAQAAEWEIDGSHTTAQFSVRHMMVSTVRGRFEKVSGTVQIDHRDATRSRVEVTIDASSINTANAKRDTHLRAPDFFDVARYPKITFRSTRVARAGGGKLKVTGDLTLHGVTRPVTLVVEPLGKPVKSPWGKQVRGISATGKLNRRDFGLTWNKALETGGVVVGDEVQLQIDAELVEKGATAAKSASR